MEEASGPPILVFPDNAATVNVFVAMRTQWRVGMNGAYGLDYGVLPQVMRMLGIGRRDWADVFDGLRSMEGVTLEHMHKK